ncbi:MAG: glycosyltransferase, partial [Pseudomonadota bacterium]
MTAAGTNVRVAIAYPSDPAGTIPGGIETFIRGIINWAPADFRFDVIGVSTDPEARPVGRWTTVELGRGSYRCLPLFAIGDPGRQSRFPASLNHLLRLWPKRRWLAREYDVVDMHRIEPAALFGGRRVALNAFFHQNMNVLHDQGSDIRWRHLPGLYFWLEGLLMKRMTSVYAVREDAVAAFRERYPAMADKFRFTPTWYDPDRFSPVAEAQKTRLRKELLAPFGIAAEDAVVTSVGRLDKQKDPLLMLDAFA